LDNGLLLEAGVLLVPPLLLLLLHSRASRCSRPLTNLQHVQEYTVFAMASSRTGLEKCLNTCGYRWFTCHCCVAAPMVCFAPELLLLGPSPITASSAAAQA
jgi:hypothetical protein